MKRLRHPASIIAVLASLFTTVGLGLSLTGSASAAPVHLVVFDCPFQPALTEPKTFILTCADGYTLFDKLSWTSWTPGLASATGTLVLNDCMPSCVAGHFHSYPALVIFWGSAAVKNHPGEHRYTMMTQILTGHRPRYFDYLTHKWVTAPVTQTSALPAPTR